MAEASGEVVGYIAARLHAAAGPPEGQFDRDRTQSSVWVDALMVRASDHRRGVGSRLLEAVEDWAMSRDTATIELDTFARSPLSVPFYERLGYVDEVERGAEEVRGRAALLLPNPPRVPATAPRPSQHVPVDPPAVDGARQPLEQRTGDEVPQQLQQRPAAGLVAPAEPPQRLCRTRPGAMLCVAVVAQLGVAVLPEPVEGRSGDDGAQQPVAVQPQFTGAGRHGLLELVGQQLEQLERRWIGAVRNLRDVRVRGEHLDAPAHPRSQSGNDPPSRIPALGLVKEYDRHSATGAP
ncbi:GNAT family N-acetyltransferase [Streptomyces chartreusis]|uniref:GNAT family N-acetyltransferase n=1 Tax=Streptomyces chartreusis TaxID=1969 RepID=UPI003CC73A86